MSDVIAPVKRIKAGPFEGDAEVVEVPVRKVESFGSTSKLWPWHGRNMGTARWFQDMKQPDVTWIMSTVGSLRDAYGVDVVVWETSEGEYRAWATWATESEPKGHFVTTTDWWLN